MRSGIKAAVVVLVNDHFFDYFIPFLESFREHNPALDLWVIPFDENIDKVRQVASLYRFKIVEFDFSAIDAFSTQLFGESTYLKNRLRKLAAFDLDLDEFLFIDVDMTVGQSLDAFFGHIRPGRIDLLFASQAKTAFKDGANLPWTHEANLFSTGMFVSSRRVATFDTLRDFFAQRRDDFLRCKVDHLYDQPLLNFFFCATSRVAWHAKRRKVRYVYSSIFGKDLEISPDGSALLKGRDIVTLAHWAGPSKLKSRVRFGQMLATLADRARRKYPQLEPFRDWTPIYQRGDADDRSEASMPGKPSQASAARKAAIALLQENLGRVEPKVILSAIYAVLPFYRDFVLVIKQSGASPGDIASIATCGLPRWMKVFCIDREDLGHLSSVHPGYPELHAMRQWLRFEGEVVFGADLRPEIEADGIEPNLVKFNLVYSVHRLRTDVILYLASGEYAVLLERLRKSRLKWMMSCVVARIHWSVLAEKVESLFLSRLATDAMKENMASFDRLCVEAGGEGGDARQAAIRASWLTEQFAKALWSDARGDHD